MNADEIDMEDRKGLWATKFTKHKHVVYVLKLEQNKYYVGFTNCFDARILQHILSGGALFTIIYKIIDVIEIYFDADLKLENEITKKYINMYGSKNVRGGNYCRITIDDFNDNSKKFEQLEIVKEIRNSRRNSIKYYNPLRLLKYTKDKPKRQTKNISNFIKEINEMDNLHKINPPKKIQIDSKDKIDYLRSINYYKF